MAFPVSWDPYFPPHMTLEDVYRYPNRHVEHHRRQLTLAATTGWDEASGRGAPRRRRRVSAPSAAGSLAGLLTAYVDPDPDPDPDPEHAYRLLDVPPAPRLQCSRSSPPTSCTPGSRHHPADVGGGRACQLNGTPGPAPPPDGWQGSGRYADLPKARS
jgi:hypothetical protein